MVDLLIATAPLSPPLMLLDVTLLIAILPENAVAPVIQNNQVSFSSRRESTQIAKEYAPCL
jgi:hypothetical protein